MKLTLSLFILSIACFSYSVLAEGHDDFKWRDMRAACKGNHDADACLSKEKKRVRIVPSILIKSTVAKCRHSENVSIILSPKFA